MNLEYHFIRQHYFFLRLFDYSIGKNIFYKKFELTKSYMLGWYRNHTELL